MIAKADKKTIVSKENKKQKKSKKNVENGVGSPTAKASRLTKEQRKEIEDQADEEAGAISKEVGELLAHLKKEHSLPDDGPLTDTSGKKKNKAKKGKLADTTVATESEWQGTKSTEFGSDPEPEIEKTVSTKKVNQKRKKFELDETPAVDEISETLPSKPKKKKKKSEAVQVAETKPHVNKIVVAATEYAENEASPTIKIEKPSHNIEVTVQEAKPKLKTEKKRKEKSKVQVKSEAPSPAKVTKKQRKNSEQSENGDNVEDELSTTNAGENESAEAKPKTEYYLKNAFPVYVGNLPTNVKKKRIIKLFKPCGDVLAVRLRTNTGSKFMKREQLKKVPFVVAFVYLKTEKAAEASLKLTGQKVGDNIIYVDRDLDKKDEKSRVNAKCTIFVGNLKYQTTNVILQETFQCCGEIEYVRTIQCKLGCNGTAYVCFKKPESVDLAMKLNKTLVLDREIRVERFHTKKLGGGKSNPKEAKLNGAALRVANKLGKEPRGKSFEPNLKAKETKNDKKKKEFLGTKSNAKKKKFDPKKKVKVSAMKKLANKIAPKASA